MTARRPANATNDFIEHIAILLEAEGMARVAGRLFGVLLVSAEPRSLDELAEQLGVSKASVSINIRFLEEKGAVERIGRQGDRRDYYRIADDMVERMLEQRLAKVRRFREAIGHARAACAAKHDSVRLRLANVDAAYQHLLDVTERALDEWRGRKGTRGPRQTARSR